MARPKKSDDASSAKRGNGFDPEQVKAFVARVENLEGEIEVLKAACKEECDPIREDIGEIIEEAEQAGIPKKELRKVLARRATERKIEAARAKLNEYEQRNYDNLRFALGELRDTPLGQAALSKAGDGQHARM
jgi:uncharacterized protein (UPF0335 family)